jgi:hypothetical protein
MELKNIYPDNPNPDAKIAFVISYPFQFYVEKDVYKHLPGNAEFILDLGVFFPVEQPESLVKSAVDLFKKHKVFYRIVHQDYYHHEGIIQNFFSKYEVLVSLWERGCMNIACNKDKKKVRLGYGSGKELTMYRPSGRRYDLTLAYGPRDSKAFSLFCECVIIGVPKFDDWFNNTLDNVFLEDVKKKLDSKKKTVLYLPTHSDLGSIKDLASSLKILAQKYNIITKLHYFNVTDEPDLVDSLRSKDIILLEDDVDLLPLFKLADVVLSDNSSAIFDSILADKPTVVTDFNDKEFFDKTHKEIKRYRRGVTRATTYSGSIEQIIKREGLIVTIPTPERLEEFIVKGLQDEDHYKGARKKLNADLVSFRDGCSGQRGAKEIMRLLNATELPERPPLSHALDTYEEVMTTSLNSIGLADKGKIEHYENLIKEDVTFTYKIFSCLVIDEEGNLQSGDKDYYYLKQTLISLYEQKYAPEKYEIVLATQLSEDVVRGIENEIKNEINRSNIPKLIIIKKEKTSLSFMKEFRNVASGEILNFTKSGYKVPSDWLFYLNTLYIKNKEVGGIGGFYIQDSQKMSWYDSYYYYTLGKKMGVRKEKNFLHKMYEVKNCLLSQNPAGDFTNMSYTKKILEEIPLDFKKITSIGFLESVLRVQTFSKGIPLLFAPMHVVRMKKITRDYFFSTGVEAGFVSRVVAGNRTYSRYSLFKALLNALESLYVSRSFKVGTAIFLGDVSRWFGFSLARVYLLKDRFEKERTFLLKEEKQPKV